MSPGPAYMVGAYMVGFAGMGIEIVPIPAHAVQGRVIQNGGGCWVTMCSKSRNCDGAVASRLQIKARFRGCTTVTCSYQVHCMSLCWCTARCTMRTDCRAPPRSRYPESRWCCQGGCCRHSSCPRWRDTCPRRDRTRKPAWRAFGK